MPPTSTPFRTAEAAWIWAAQSLAAARRPLPGAIRPEDIVKCLDTLYRQRRIELLHARILRIWGQKGTAPNPGRPRERSDWRLWREAIGMLDAPLRARGIVEGELFELDLRPLWQSPDRAVPDLVP